MRWIGRAVGAVVVLGLIAWGALALHYDAPGHGDPLAIGWIVATLAILFVVRPWRRALMVFVVVLAGLLAWWTTIAPRNDRDWLPDVARLPTGQVHGDLLTIHNVRDFDYRSETDFTERWETRTYDLAQLERLDLFLSYWSGPAIAHTILSWAFRDGQHLAISIETRKERGETYSAIGGFFKQYELYYVVADERDLVRLRTNYRGESVHCYPLRTSVERARKMLLDYVAAMNAIAAHPQWYNAATQNCTTTIRTHVIQIGATMPWDWRILVNGYIDEMLYARGVIAMPGAFADVRERSLIDARAKAADADPRFSDRIRDGIVAAPPP